MTTGEIFDQLARRLQANPAKFQGVNATFQFRLTGEDGGSYHVTVAGDDVTVEAGEAAAAGCTVTMAAADFKAMVAGQLNPVAAFMGGKLRLDGDMALAMKLQSLLK